MRKKQDLGGGVGICHSSTDMKYFPKCKLPEVQCYKEL